MPLDEEQVIIIIKVCKKIPLEEIYFAFFRLAFLKLLA
jgi:hypothetical protein